MKTNRNLILLFSLAFALTFSGCEIVEGIFNIGFWVGVIVVVVIVLLILWLFNKMRR